MRLLRPCSPPTASNLTVRSGQIQVTISLAHSDHKRNLALFHHRSATDIVLVLAHLTNNTPRLHLLHPSLPVNMARLQLHAGLLNQEDSSTTYSTSGGS